MDLAGELIAKGGARLQRCAIRDMSLDGARIDTGFYIDVPRRLFLLEEESGSLFECEVRWQQGREIGLFFLDVSGRSARQSLIQKHA